MSDLGALLWTAIADAGSMRAFASKHSIALSTVSETANGKRDMTEAIANALGFVRVVTFRQIAKPEAA